MKRMSHFFAGEGRNKPAGANLSVYPQDLKQNGNSTPNLNMLSSYDDRVTSIRLPPAQSSPRPASRLSNKSMQGGASLPGYFDQQPNGTTTPIPNAAPPPHLAVGSQARPMSPRTPDQNSADSRSFDTRFPLVASAPANEDRSLDRNELHKMLKALEVLLFSFNEYRTAQTQIAKLESKLAKSCSDLVKTKGLATLPSNALQLTSTILDSQSDASSKYAKVIQKEYESMNDACARFFKKTAKDERTHEEQVNALEAKLRKTQLNYAKRTSAQSMEAHEQYIASLSTMSAEIARIKAKHAANLAAKSHATNLLVASAMGGLVDLSFRSHCEQVKQAGPHVGPLASMVNFCVHEAMPALQPADLTEEELGRASALAIAEAQAEANQRAREAAEARAREEALAAWKAQQMGWMSPEEVQRRTTVTARHPPPSQPLPRLDSQGMEVEPRCSSYDVATSQSSESQSSMTSPTVNRSYNSAEVSLRLRTRSIAESKASSPPPLPDLPAHLRAQMAADDDDSTHTGTTPAPRHQREESLWEKEQAKRQQVALQADLQRRLRQAEDRLRFVEAAHHTVPNGSGSGSSGSAHSKHKEGSSGSAPREATSSSSLASSSTSPAFDSMPSSHLQRTLSSDSERSFVAQMKLRYQAEKDAKRAGQLTALGEESLDDRTIRPRHQSQPLTTKSSNIHRSLPPSILKEEHLDVCGCADCAVKRYGNGTIEASKKTNEVTIVSPSEMGKTTTTLPKNERRVTMPVGRGS